MVFASTLEYKVRKINTVFPLKQNILLVYVNMSFGISSYLNHIHGSNMCFIWKMDLRMFIVKIESYRDILLYFCEIGNIKKYLILVYMVLVNGYKPYKCGIDQWI